MTTDNFCFHLQNRLIQTCQTGGQWYSDTSPFSIPCIGQVSERVQALHLLLWSFVLNEEIHFHCQIFQLFNFFSVPVPNWFKPLEWKGINHKQSTRWWHLSRLKASVFFSLQIFLVVMKHSNLYLGLVLPSGGWQSLIKFWHGQLRQWLFILLSSILNFETEIDEIWKRLKCYIKTFKFKSSNFSIFFLCQCQTGLNHWNWCWHRQLR